MLCSMPVKITYSLLLHAEYRADEHAESSLEDRNQHRRNYEEIIEKEKTLNVRSVRFINLGIPRSGKTTFWRRLTKQIVKMDENQPSTGVADEHKLVVAKKVSIKDEVKIESGIVTPDEWQVLDQSEYAKMLLDMFSQVVEFSTQTLTTDSVLVPADISPEVSTISENLTSDSLTDINAQAVAVVPSPPVPNIETSFASIFNEALESNWDMLKCKLEDIILLNTADTGGHAEFLDMHAALINGPSFNLFFCRLIDELGKPFKVYFTDEDSTSTEKEDSDSTLKEVIFQALSSITCFGKTHCAVQTQMSSDDTDTIKTDTANLQKALESQQSKVMFVGTYMDEVSEKEFEMKNTELLQEVKDTEFFKNVMFADHDKGQLMLKVNNKSGGEAEVDENRRILKEKIEKCFPRLCIPASWFVLSLEIHNHSHPTMTLEHCEMLAKGFNIERKDLQTALWFLHHGLGVLLYYPVGGLKATVFCKIQAIYKSVKNLIKKAYTARFVQHESSLTEFKNLGVFSLEEIEVAPDSLIPRNLLVQLLEHLNIITSAPPALSPTGIKNPYLMPCLLRCSRQEVPHGGNSEPLKLRFKCGFTPVGVFPAMITKLVRDSKWVILPEQDRIFKNRVRFRVGRNIIYLMSHLRYFEIVILEQCNLATELFLSIRGELEDTMKKVTDYMNYDFWGGHEYAFWCTKCINCDKHHLAVVKDATPSAPAFLECCRDKAVTDDLKSSQKVWFSKASEGKKLLGSKIIRSPSPPLPSPSSLPLHAPNPNGHFAHHACMHALNTIMTLSQCCAAGGFLDYLPPEAYRSQRETRDGAGAATGNYGNMRVSAHTIFT